MADENTGCGRPGEEIGVVYDEEKDSVSVPWGVWIRLTGEQYENSVLQRGKALKQAYEAEKKGDLVRLKNAVVGAIYWDNEIKRVMPSLSKGEEIGHLEGRLSVLSGDTK